MSERANRLAEVERLSRRPHAELHTKLLDVITGAMDRLSPEEWLTLAKKSPDRLVQALSMSGRLAGYSERSEVQVSGLAAQIERMTDAELEARSIELATERLRRLAKEVPRIGRVIATLTPVERQVAIIALYRERQTMDPVVA